MKSIIFLRSVIEQTKQRIFTKREEGILTRLNFFLFCFTVRKISMQCRTESGVQASMGGHRQAWLPTVQFKKPKGAGSGNGGGSSGGGSSGGGSSGGGSSGSSTQSDISTLLLVICRDV